MKASIKIALFFVFILFSSRTFSQVNSLELNPEKEKMFSKYMVFRHGGADGLAEFKKNKPHEYLKELWYYSESFYIKRDYFQNGGPLDLSMIPVDRYENLRLENEEAVVIFPGSKDVLILLAANKLIYRP